MSNLRSYWFVGSDGKITTVILRSEDVAKWSKDHGQNFRKGVSVSLELIDKMKHLEILCENAVGNEVDYNPMEKKVELDRYLDAFLPIFKDNYEAAITLNGNLYCYDAKNKMWHRTRNLVIS